MNLIEIRDEIDLIDQKMMSLLAERVDLAKKAGAEKKKIGKEIYDAKREEEIIQKIVGKAKSFGLSKDFTERIYKEIIKNCREEQR